MPVSSTRFGLVAAVLVAASTTTACYPSRPHLSFAVEQRLLRETTLDDMPEGVAGPHDGIVRVLRFGKGSTGACSGALVDQRHVITAAHCVMRLDEGNELTMNVIEAGSVHVELGGDYLPWGRVGVTHVRVCDGYVRDLQHDIAMLVLSRPVPYEVPTFALGYDVPQDEAAVFEIGGFGSLEKAKQIPDWGPIISVNRHIVRGPVLHVSDDVVILNVPGKPGDSGGPIIDTKTSRLVSVVSRGGAGEEGEDTTVSNDPNNKKATPSKTTPRGSVRAGDEKPQNEKKTPALVGGPRLYTCKKAIDETLRR